MIEQSKHYALAITCGAKRGPKDTDLTFSPSSLRDFLKALAEQPTQQEPLKPKFVRNVDGVPCITLVEHEHLMRFRTSPPASPTQSDIKPWVGLTDEEMKACTQSPFVVENYRAIEAKLREKNT